MVSSVVCCCARINFKDPTWVLVDCWRQIDIVCCCVWILFGCYLYLGNVVHMGWVAELFWFFFWSNVLLLVLFLDFILTIGIQADSGSISKIRLEYWLIVNGSEYIVCSCARILFGCRFCFLVTSYKCSNLVSWQHHTHSQILFGCRYFFFWSNVCFLVLISDFILTIGIHFDSCLISKIGLEYWLIVDGGEFRCFVCCCTRIDVKDPTWVFVDCWRQWVTLLVLESCLVVIFVSWQRHIHGLVSGYVG